MAASAPVADKAINYYVEKYGYRRMRDVATHTFFHTPQYRNVVAKFSDRMVQQYEARGILPFGMLV